MDNHSSIIAEAERKSRAQHPMDVEKARERMAMELFDFLPITYEAALAIAKERLK
jgi:hypothetical protein